MSLSRTAIVFGGSGFLGHALVPLLAARGWQVRVPSRFPSKTQDLRGTGLAGQIIPLHASVRTDAAVAAALEGCSLVVNLIGSLSEKNVGGYQVAHVEVAARIARLAREAGASQFLHVSALGAERDAQEAYAQTKARGEEAVRAFFARATILRPSLMFGPRDQFFNRLALLARYSPCLPLFGQGRARFQPVFVGDVAAAMVEALARPEAAGGTFDVAGNDVYSLRELFSQVLQATGRRRFLLPVPLALGRAAAAALSVLPDPPLTRDQLEMLQRDSITNQNALPLWGIEPKPLAPALEEYLC